MWKTFNLSALSVLLILVILAGCGDTMYYSTQEYTLQIESRATGEALAGATVTSIADSDREAGETDEQYVARIAEKERTSPFAVVQVETDFNGLAVLRHSGVIYRGDDGVRHIDSDATGWNFLVRIQQEDVDEIVHLEMLPGNEVMGEFFAVGIVAIGEDNACMVNDDSCL